MIEKVKAMIEQVMVMTGQVNVMIKQVKKGNRISKGTYLIFTYNNFYR